MCCSNLDSDGYEALHALGLDPSISSITDYGETAMIGLKGAPLAWLAPL